MTPSSTRFGTLYRLCAESMEKTAAPKRPPTTVELGVLFDFEREIKLPSDNRRRLANYIYDDLRCDQEPYRIATEFGRGPKLSIGEIVEIGKTVRKVGYQSDRRKWRCKVFSDRYVSVERSLDEHWDKVDGTVFPDESYIPQPSCPIREHKNDNSTEICILAAFILGVGRLRVDQITPRAWAQLHDDHINDPGRAQVILRVLTGAPYAIGDGVVMEGLIADIDTCVKKSWDGQLDHEKRTLPMRQVVSCVLNQIPQMTFNTIDGVTCCDGFYRVYEDAVHEELSYIVLPTPLQQETVQQQLTQWLSPTSIVEVTGRGQRCTRGEACNGNSKAVRVILDRLPPTLVVILPAHIFHTDANAEHVFDDLKLEYVCLHDTNRILYGLVGATFLQTNCDHPTLHWRGFEEQSPHSGVTQHMGLRRRDDRLETDPEPRAIEDWWGNDSTEKQYMTPTVLFFRMM